MNFTQLEGDPWALIQSLPIKCGPSPSTTCTQLTFQLTIIDFYCHLSKVWDELSVGFQFEVRILQSVDVLLLGYLLISHLCDHCRSTSVQFHLHGNSVYGHVLDDDDRFTRLTLESKQGIHTLLEGPGPHLRNEFFLWAFPD